MSKYPINEIFASIQGEGSRAGEKCVFIRFQGCNLNCPYCDTKEAIEKDNSKSMNDLDLILEVEEYKDINTVVFTGGEPLLWLDEDLMEHFKPSFDEDEYKTYNIIIQTNGTQKLSDKIKEFLTLDDLICCDIKCNSSNFMEEFFTAYNNVYSDFLRIEFKVPVDNVDTALSIDRQVGKLKEGVRGMKGITVYLSPIISENEDIEETYKKFVELDLQHTKLNFQIHKLIGVK